MSSATRVWRNSPTNQAEKAALSLFMRVPDSTAAWQIPLIGDQEKTMIEGLISRFLFTQICKQQ